MPRYLRKCVVAGLAVAVAMLGVLPGAASANVGNATLEDCSVWSDHAGRPFRQKPPGIPWRSVRRGGWHWNDCIAAMQTWLRETRNFYVWVGEAWRTAGFPAGFKVDGKYGSVTSAAVHWYFGLPAAIDEPAFHGKTGRAAGKAVFFHMAAQCRGLDEFSGYRSAACKHD
jgi:hypothetical protein